MSTYMVVVGVLIALIFVAVFYRIVKSKREKATQERQARLGQISFEKIEEMNVKGDILAEKADALSERMDRLTALLELTENPRRDEEEESPRRAASRRRPG